MVPYDILTTISLTNPIANWNWLGFGYTSNNYTFTNQPGDQAFYILAKPSQTIVQAWGGNADGELNAPPGLTNAAMLTGGVNFSVALTMDGRVLAWGGNAHGETNVPANLTNATVVTAGYNHGLALRADGTLSVWGSWWNNGSYVTPNLPSGLTNVVAISAGVDHDLVAKADGTVLVWGYTNEIYNTMLPSLAGVKDVEAGWNHNVALLTNGTVVAWGMNYGGAFNWNVTNVPAGLSNVVAIAAGGYHTLALKSDGRVVAWGAGNSIYGPWFADQGQSIVPTGLSNVVAIAAGGYHSLALKKDGTVVEWGDVSLPSYNLKQIIGLGSGVHHDLALRDGPLSPPTIVSQSPMLTNRVAIYQTNLTLSVTASSPESTNGFPLGYQWRFNGINIGGANSNTYALFMDATNAGAYSVIVANTVGSVTSQVWQVTISYAGTYIASGTLAYHLSTNTAGHASGITNLPDIYQKSFAFSGWTFADYTGANLYLMTNAVWSTNFWLKGVQGLSATCLGFTNGYGGGALVTMISPRHCIYASHKHSPPGYFMAAFLDTNNVIYWRTNMENIYITNDISIGILNADLPSSVGFLPVLPGNFTNYLPTNAFSYAQGIGMNQDMRVFAQPMAFGDKINVNWDSSRTSPFGLSTDWNVTIRVGDSSNPERILIGNQLILVTHNSSVPFGPNYAYQIDAINRQMHYLSTNNIAGTDYQLNLFALTNWPTIH